MSGTQMGLLSAKVESHSLCTDNMMTDDENKQD